MGDPLKILTANIGSHRSTEIDAVMQRTRGRPLPPPRPATGTGGWTYLWTVSNLRTGWSAAVASA